MDAPIGLYGTTQVIWYPDQVSRPIHAQAGQRVRDSANMLRRTVRLAVNQKGPRKKMPDGWVVIGRSLPGEVPFRESGALYGGVGFDFVNRKASFEIDGTVSVDSHGLELGRTTTPPGVQRPHLKPAWELNRSLMVAIVEGRTSAPQYGDLSFARHRSLQLRTGVNKRTGQSRSIARTKAGRLSYRLIYRDPAVGEFRAIRPRAIRTAA